MIVALDRDLIKQLKRTSPTCVVLGSYRVLNSSSCRLPADTDKSGIDRDDVSTISLWLEEVDETVVGANNR